MRFWDRLPTVISCCFCCFLRAGTVMIALVSFTIGAIFAPNINNSPGFWDLSGLLSNYKTSAESFIQTGMGVVHIGLCTISVLLLVGSLCNIPVLILVYQYGAILYSILVVLMYIILAGFCFFVHSDCFLAGLSFLVLIVCHVLLTTYFVLVSNSLRLSLQYLNIAAASLAA